MIENEKMTAKLTQKEQDMAELEREFKIFRINSEELMRKIN